MNTPTTAPPQSQTHPIVQFKRDLGRMIDGKELALPSNVSAEAFRNAAIVAVQDNPEILRCNAGSVMKALRTLAGAGLVPDGREAAIVPYKGQAQAMPMVAGLIKTARNSGKIKSLWAEVVYEGETVKVWIEDGERKWDHVQNDGSPVDAMSRGGGIRGAYAVAKLDDGTVEFRPMSKDEIEKRRMASANQKGAEPTGIWAKWYDEMAMKTVIRNLCKRLPMSTEDVTRLMVDHDAPPRDMRDVTPQEEPRQNLAARLKQQETEQPEPERDEEPAGSEPEILPPENDGHWTDEVPREGGFPGSDEWSEGMTAYQDGFPMTDCPYEDDAAKAVDWVGGYLEGEKENK